MELLALNNFIITITVFSALVTILLSSLVAYGMYEDQYMLCDFNDECFVFDQDDYLSNSQIEEFQLFLDNDMDTFDVESDQ